MPSMYAEDDAFEDEQFTRSADIRQSRASLSRGSRYYTEGFVQYSQPSLNGTYPRSLFAQECCGLPFCLCVVYIRSVLVFDGVKEALEIYVLTEWIWIQGGDTFQLTTWLFFCHILMFNLISDNLIARN